MNTLIILLSLMVSASSATKTHNDTSTMKLDMTKYDKINVYNFHGNVSVNSITSSNAVIRSKRKLEATSSKKLQRAMNEIYLDTMTMDGELYLYIEDPHKSLESIWGDYLNYQDNNTEYRHSGIKSVGIKYEFDLDLELPSNVDAVISTHKGDINLSGIKGELSVLNHQGNINLEGVHQVDHVKSHHGELKVKFDEQPDNDVSFATHHGDISVSFRNTPSAQLDLDSYHGSFFTDFDWKPSPSTTLKKNENGKTKYKVGDTTNIQIGGGKHVLKFRSHHGNIHILKH